MDPTLPVHIRWQGKTVGPFTAEQLRELIPTGAVTPATEIALEPEGPWVRLDTVPLGGAVFPTVAFKTPAYERANTADSAPIDLRDVIAAAQRPASPTPPAAPAPPARPVSAEHDVPSLLRFNQTLDEKRGGYVLAPKPKRRSRRRRDYALLLLLVGVPLFLILFLNPVRDAWTRTHGLRFFGEGGTILTQVFLGNPYVAVWGIGGFIFFAGALTWIMYYVMDDY
ncbi:MAG: hypothetical protein JSS11_09955 [Verrucomicrobia bacterium]|nr:hypothetical protein [Verrucomicrobiota bacterium]